MNMLKLIKKPLFTEKTTRLIEEFNQYVFEVDRSATKHQIRRLVESRFSVVVCDVNTHRLPYTINPRSRTIRQKKNRKRAFVTLAASTRIAFFPRLFSYFFFN